MRKTEKNKGITLMVLVITIVIMLILAGVSYQIAFSENGLVTKSKNAKEKTRGQIIQTEVTKWKENAELEYGAGNKRTYSYDDFLDELLEDNLLKNEYITSNDEIDEIKNTKKITIGGVNIDFTLDFLIEGT
jgi:hypothetical protein